MNTRRVQDGETSGVTGRTKRPLTSTTADVAGPGSSTDNAVARFDGNGGKTIQNSKTTISDAGVMTVDDGSGNSIVLTPASLAPTITTLERTLTITANHTSAALFTINNATTDQGTTLRIGSDESGGTGSINVDNLTARLTDGPLTLSGNGTGLLVLSGNASADGTITLLAGGVLDANGIIGEVIVQTGAITPVHSASEGTVYWDTVADALFVNNNGTTGWTAITGGGGGGDVTAADDLDAAKIVVGDDGAKGVIDTGVNIDGSDNITAVASLDSTGLIAAATFNSDVATGTAPITVTSANVCTNLNADKLDGLDVGTSGSKIPRLNASNTFSGRTTIALDDDPAFLVEMLGGDDVFRVSTDTNSHIVASANGTGEFRCERDLDVTGNIVVSGTVDGRDVLADGTRLDSVVERQATFSFVDPVTGQDFLLDGVPVGATITECYAICNGGTSVEFGIVMRIRSAPFSAGTVIVNVATPVTATTTGGTKTLTSTTYTADNVLRLVTDLVTGSVTELLVILVYTID